MSELETIFEQRRDILQLRGKSCFNCKMLDDLIGELKILPPKGFEAYTETKFWNL